MEKPRKSSSPNRWRTTGYRARNDTGSTRSVNDLEIKFGNDVRLVVVVVTRGLSTGPLDGRDDALGARQ